MQTPLQVTFRGMNPSEIVDSAIRARIARLEHFHDRIVHCHVVVDVPHKHQRKGHHFTVRLDMTTPTGVIAVARDSHLDATHDNFHVVLRDAFDAAERQLEDETRRSRGEVKRHQEAV